jgi:DNA repair protein RAD5
VILDEAHNIKGRQTNQSKAASMLESHYRWCLTGTPIQNKYDDLFSLINFLRVETFSEYFWWNTYINKENDQERDNILKAIISPILLRRTKQCSDNDEGIVLDLQ